MAIIGRDHELGVLAAAVGTVRDGSCATVVMVGDPGIGKTTLLQHVSDSAHGLSVRALRVAAVDAEAQLPFAGLSQLLAPLRVTLEEHTGAGLDALRAALGLGPPVAADRFAAYVGLVTLLTRVVAEGPLLVVVDDAHWLDAPTAEALAFAMPRLADDAVGLVVATRPPVPGWIDAVEGDHLALGPLDAVEAAEVLTRACPGLDEGIRRRVLALAAGNPLALTELARRPDPADAPTRGGDPLLGSFAATVADLPRATREALLRVALEDEGRDDVLRRALGIRGQDHGVLGPAVDAGVLARAAPGFRHPLFREVVRLAASPGERRAAHRDLAAALDGAGDVEARGRHLGAAAVGPDEDVARALEEAAGRALGRTAYAAAVDLLERAAQVSADSGAQGARLLSAGYAAFGAGRPLDALRLLDGALEVTEGTLRGRVAQARGMAALLVEPLDAVMAFLVREAERVQGVDRPLAAAMLADAVMTRTMGGWCDQAVGLARQARATLAPGDPVPPNVTAYLAAAHVLAGDTAPAAEAMVQFEVLADTLDPVSPAGHLLAIASTPLAWTGRLPEACRRLDGWVARAREAGAVGFTALALAQSVEIRFRLGRWDEGVAHGDEALALLEATGQLGAVGYALSNLAMIRAGQGEEAATRALVAQAEPFIAAGAGSLFAYVRAALGLLANGFRRGAEAVAVLEPLEHFARERGLRRPGVVMWQPDLVEAYMRLRRPPDARRILATLAEQSQRTGDRWGLAVTHRCRGLLAEDFDGAFRTALAVHDELEMPFERARTQLLYGERLRRARRRVESRAQLSAALATFERLGAAPWAQQARDELAASGVRRRAPAPDEVRALTPRELQVALLVAEGLRNQDVAARLFVSEKTVERHLSLIYAKLGVRNRAALVRRMGGPADEGRPRAPARG